MDIVDIDRLTLQSKISSEYKKVNAAIEDHLVVIDELKGIIEFECSKDPLGTDDQRPDSKMMMMIGKTVQRSTMTLSDIFLNS